MKQRDLSVVAGIRVVSFEELVERERAADLDDYPEEDRERDLVAVFGEVEW